MNKDQLIYELCSDIFNYTKNSSVLTSEDKDQIHCIFDSSELELSDIIALLVIIDNSYNRKPTNVIPVNFR